MIQETRDDSGNYVDAVMIVPPVVSVRDSDASDSNKSWTVPANELWKITRACVGLVTSATVGNRVFTLQEEDADGNVLQKLVSGNVQAASATVSYCCLQGIFRETSVVNGSIQVPIPEDFFIPGGHVVRVWDSAAIDANHDDMIVNFQYMKILV